ncbi:uncharacterized protein B0H18DRAFT_51889 [Fomitopsis serialis]|uniref:uncharacterized protein n=1 Tax=Fomitopsis serialis TaxID=139415 RepID=UPI00200756F0|nr:uncharacterized protein B0H18DRAFT_51889 [Neoantrodia serialis]KAH9932259.1 hypothetical protein B0H18DRAFT_51889 [Neoantrodia serialis]
MAKKRHACPVCATAFLTLLELRRHGNSMKHGLVGIFYVCSDCNRNFQTAKDLQNHASAKRHRLYKPVSSTVAASSAFDATSVPAQTTLATTSATLPPSPAAQYRCQVCTLSFSSEAEINAHYKRSFVHPSCSTCGEGFRDNERLSQHLRATHGTDTIASRSAANTKLDDPSTSSSRSICSTCLMTFTDDAKLFEHENTDHLCARCDQWFSGRRALRQHFNESSMHPSCFHCQKGFVGDVEFSKHLVEEHDIPIAAELVSTARSSTEANRAPSSPPPPVYEQLETVEVPQIEV